MQLMIIADNVKITRSNLTYEIKLIMHIWPHVATLIAQIDIGW